MIIVKTNIHNNFHRNKIEILVFTWYFEKLTPIKYQFKVQKIEDLKVSNSDCKIKITFFIKVVRMMDLY